MDLTERLGELARAAGAAGWGVCTAEGFPDMLASLRQRRSSGASAGMAFTFRVPEVSSDVRKSYPWASRLFVVAVPYLPDAGSPQPGSGRGRVARFATRDHYRKVRAVLLSVADALRELGFRAECLTDDNRLVDRAAAVRAGVGWWGKNTMVLAPGAGPWILLGSVVTNADLTPGEPMKRSCGTCAACLPACPTGALVAPGLLDARLCLAYWLQAPGVIPAPLRAAAADRIYGCDDCLEACPPGDRLLQASGDRRGDVDLVGLLAADDESLLTAYSHFYIPERRARYLRRNALVALGNVGGDAAAAVLAGYVGHPDWLLRAHAAWALGMLEHSAEAGAVLEHAREREHEQRVRDEIEAALAGPAGSLAGTDPGLR